MRSEELLRLGSLIEEEESSFNAVNSTMAGLTDHEDTMFIQWNDEASRGIRTRFAIPREEDAKGMMDRMKTACEDAAVVLSQADKVFACANEISKISGELHRALEEGRKLSDEAGDLSRRCLDKVRDFEDIEQESISTYNQLSDLVTSFNQTLKQRRRVY